MLAHNQEVLGSYPATSQLFSRDPATWKFVWKKLEAKVTFAFLIGLNMHSLVTKNGLNYD